MSEEEKSKKDKLDKEDHKEKENKENEVPEEGEEEKKKMEKESKKKEKEKEENKEESNKENEKKVEIKKGDKIIENEIKKNNINSTSPVTTYSYSSLQLLSNINSEMDSLSKILNSKFGIFSPPYMNSQNYNNDYNPSFIINNNNNNYYDKEDFEIKQLITKANQLINNNENNIKLNILNNYNKKFENKITQSDDFDFNYPNNTNNIFTNNLNNNYNNNLNSNFLRYNYQQNRLDRYRNNSSKNNSFFENNDSRMNYYINNRKKSIDNGLYRLNRKKLINNNDEDENFDNDNEIFQKYDFNNSKKHKNEGTTFDANIINRTKKIDDLYKFNNSLRKKPIVYIQPDSFPLYKTSSSHRNDYIGDNNYNKNGRYSFSRDNIYKKKNSYLRFDDEGVKRAIDILNGKI